MKHSASLRGPAHSLPRERTPAGASTSQQDRRRRGPGGMSTTMAPPDVAELLTRAGWARRLARRIAGDDADDLLQEAWLAASGRGGEIARPRSWLGTVLRNLAINRQVAARRRQERDEAFSATLPPPSSPEDLLA